MVSKRKLTGARERWCVVVFADLLLSPYSNPIFFSVLQCLYSSSLHVLRSPTASNLGPINGDTRARPTLGDVQYPLKIQIPCEHSKIKVDRKVTLGLVKFDVLPSPSPHTVVNGPCTWHSFCSCLFHATTIGKKSIIRVSASAQRTCVSHPPQLRQDRPVMGLVTLCGNARYSTVRLYFLYGRHCSWSSHPGTGVGAPRGGCQTQPCAEGHSEGGQGE